MNPALGLAAGRIAIGSVVLASPALGTRLFRLDPDANRQLPYLARLFGSREIVLGAATVLARGRTRRNLVLAGVGVDAADAAAAVLSGREGALDRQTQVLLTVPAVIAVVVGVRGLVRGS
jgi:hypothetical protein